jgi:selenium-binding protein 1
MKRRKFLKTTSGAAVAASLTSFPSFLFADEEAACCDRTWATPADAMKSPAETLAYVPCIRTGTGVDLPDYLATIDVDPKSATYGTVLHRLPMPNVGDELHHFGWNACSSCHGQDGANRRFIVLPGIASSRIHIVDTSDPKKPKIHKVIEGEDIKKETGLSAPHTVHCLADGNIMISMLGMADGSAPGGFMMLDKNFEIAGRWTEDTGPMKFNYDFWYQPRHNVMVSSEWGAPNTVSKGFNPAEVAEGKYGRQLHFWDWKEREIKQSIDLGENGLIPLEVRFHHNPDSTHGFVGAALSSTIFHWHHDSEKWRADRVIAVESIEKEGWPFPVPGLVTDIVLSMDDRFLYFSNWLHGDLRQYDVSDPENPKLTGQVWLGGVLGKPTPKVKGKELAGGCSWTVTPKRAG